MATKATIIFEQQVPKANRKELENLMARASRAVGLRGVVNVMVTNNQRLRQLNAQFRGKNSPTDVLSFPAENSSGLAGDIAISADIAARNARMLGHSISEEIRILILHGILHLAGYDHENDRGEMEKIEMSLRRKFGLPLGLIERNSNAAKSLAAGHSSFAKFRRSGALGRRRTANDRRRLLT